MFTNLSNHRNWIILTGVILITLLAIPTLAFADDDVGEVDPLANPIALVMANDGVSSLPVFKGPFPETENMVFLSQLSPDDIGAEPVPGVWAKGMMNDLWGWTSPGGEEYALATNSGGIAVVRVTDPANPVYL